LYKKGFEDLNNKSDEHIYLEFYYEGEFILYTKLSHNMDDLGDFLIGQMSKQCKLKKDDFLNLARCPLSQEEYEQKLRDQNLIL